MQGGFLLIYQYAIIPLIGHRANSEPENNCAKSQYTFLCLQPYISHIHNANIYNKPHMLCGAYYIIVYLYSSQLFTGISFTSILQNAFINALAKRAFVMSGMLWSIAARRMR